MKFVGGTRARGSGISVKSFGARGDGATDDTAAILDAIDTMLEWLSAAYAGRSATLYFPTGNYLVTDALWTEAIAGWINIRGDGPGSSKIIFAPTEAATCFAFANNAEMCQAIEIGNIMIYGAGTAQKTAIDLTDTSRCLIDNVAIHGFTSTDKLSTGLLTRGRECLTLRKTDIAADMPIDIELNPNLASGGLDHFHMQDTLLTNLDITKAGITIGAGLAMSNWSTSGYFAACLGKHTIYWHDDTPTAVESINIAINNLRHEQGSASGWGIVIDGPTVDNVLISNCMPAGEGNGLYLRNIANLTLLNCAYQGVLTALDIDDTCTDVAVVNCPGFTRNQSLGGATVNTADSAMVRQTVEGMISAGVQNGITATTDITATGWSNTLPDSYAGGGALVNARIFHAPLTHVGSKVRITLKAHAMHDTVVSHACFAECSGGDGTAAGAFGSDKFKELLFSSLAGATVSAGTELVSDWLEFDTQPGASYMTILLYTSDNIALTSTASDGVLFNGSGDDHTAQTITGYTAGGNTWSVSRVEVETVGAINLDAIGTPADAIGDPSGGGTQDAEARTAIGLILDVLRDRGYVAT